MRRCAAWVTEWSEKIRRNLPVKIFCFTCLLLVGCLYCDLRSDRLDDAGDIPGRQKPRVIGAGGGV